MSKNSAELTTWEAALHAHFQSQLASAPLPERAAFTPDQEWQCRILGGSILSWLEKYGPALLRERKFLDRSEGVETDPVIILISTIPGLVAAQEMMDPRPPSIYYFTKAAFDDFLAVHPDPDYRWHVRYTSVFEESLDPKAKSKAVKDHPIPSSDQYWLHRETSLLGRLFGRGGSHLWRWNGREPKLLEEGFESWLS